MFYNPSQTEEINAALDRWLTEEEESEDYASEGKSEEGRGNRFGRKSQGDLGS